MQALVLVFAILGSASDAKPFPDPEWTSRRPGDRALFVPGYRRPPLILEAGPKHLDYRRGAPLSFSLQFTAWARIDTAPTDFAREDWRRLALLVWDGSSTRIVRLMNGDSVCGVRVLASVGPGARWGTELSEREVDLRELFPADGSYSIQFIYDQGQVLAESNWLTVTVGGGK